MLDDLVNIFDDFTKNQRTQNLAQLGLENDLTFAKREAFGIQITFLKGFKIFSTKGKKRFIGILSLYLDKIGANLRFYDYLNTKDLETKTTSVIEICCEEMDTEYFRISPKNSLRKLAKYFKISRNRNTVNDDFLNQYKITLKNSLHPFKIQESVQLLLLKNPGLTIEAEGNYFLFYYKRKEIKIQDILYTFDVAEDFIKLLYLDYSEDFV